MAGVIFFDSSQASPVTGGNLEGTSPTSATAPDALG